MVFYVVKRSHACVTTRRAPAFWKKELYPWFRWFSYERLVRSQRLPRGTYIFANLDRISAAEAERAARIRERLAAEGLRVLNHPTRTPKRYELLRLLRDNGTNSFGVYRLTELRMPERYPVFIRDEDAHASSMSELLGSPEELRAHLEAMGRRGERRDGKLVIEFCDTRGAEGLYRKYGAFIVGDRVVPRHLFTGRSWSMHRRDSETARPEFLREELDYLERNPHEEALRGIARSAGIQYGRIDYGMLGGKPQVWEVNTNATYFSKSEPLPERRKVEEMFARKMVEAFAAIDERGTGGFVDVAEKADLRKALKSGVQAGLQMLPERWENALRCRLHIYR